ncbi:unnamed protein product [Caenorhabditis nigoni]
MRSPICNDLPGQLGWQGIRSILRRLVASLLDSDHWDQQPMSEEEWILDDGKSWMMATVRKLRMRYSLLFRFLED